MSCTLIPGKLLASYSRLSNLELCEISDPPIPLSLSPIPSSPTHVLLTRQEKEREEVVANSSLFWWTKAKAIFKGEIKNKIMISRGRAQMNLTAQRVVEETESSEKGRKTDGRRSRGRESTTFLSSFRILLVFNDRPMGWEDRYVCRSFS